MADDREAGHRECALPERARECDPHHQPESRRRRAHRADDQSQRREDGSQDRATPKTIDRIANPQRAGGSNQRGPEVDLRIGDAIEREISEEWFGDQAKPLRAPRQRPNHRRGGNREHEPAVRRTHAPLE